MGPVGRVSGSLKGSISGTLRQTSGLSKRATQRAARHISMDASERSEADGMTWMGKKRGGKRIRKNWENILENNIYYIYIKSNQEG